MHLFYSLSESVSDPLKFKETYFVILPLFSFGIWKAVSVCLKLSQASSVSHSLVRLSRLKLTRSSSSHFLRWQNM
ncbi:unnamed protein product [Brassica oleracea]